MSRKLVKNLAAAGREAVVLSGPESGDVVVLPFGGRILGLFASGDETNFLWNNSVLREPEKYRRFQSSGQWQNPGGERVWLAPEVDLFYPNLPAKDPYFQPRTLDSVDYRCERRGDSICLTNTCKLTHFRLKQEIEVRMEKSVRTTMNPLRQTEVGRGLQFAGYEVTTSLEFIGQSQPAIAAWTLLQLPNDGEMLLPTYAETQPTNYFGQIPPGDLEVKPRGVRFRMREPDGQKIGLPATVSPGRLGYHYGTAEMSQLVIRNFTVNPSAQYIDIPWGGEEGRGCPIQICHVDHPALGQFSELEYHAPAIGGTTGLTRGEDSSQVWAFRGPFAEVNKVSELLLGMSLKPWA